VILCHVHTVPPAFQWQFLIGQEHPKLCLASILGTFEGIKIIHIRLIVGIDLFQLFRVENGEFYDLELAYKENGMGIKAFNTHSHSAYRS
jgi:hypothetical protein